MLKDATANQQLTIITKLFERFEFNYDAMKYKVWRADNSPLFWVTCLAESTSETLKAATIKCFEVDFQYELPTAPEFALLCGIKPVEAAAPIVDGVDTGTGEIIDHEPAKQEYEPPPQGFGWAKKLWQRQQAGEKLPVDSIRMMRYALRLGD
jgi:hypothetical protein